MKFLVATILVLFTVAITQADTYKETYDNAIKECGKEIDDDLSFMNPAEGIPDFVKLITDPKYKCVPKCIFIKFGIMDEDGNYLKDKLQEFTPVVQEEEMFVLQNCFNESKDPDLCKETMNITSCIIKKREEKVTNV